MLAETESSPIIGYIAEIVFFANPGDELKIEGYLAHKWNLASNLAGNHPYKTYWPF